MYLSKKNAVIFLVFSLVILGIGLLYLAEIRLTGFEIYNQEEQANFDEGIYENTEYDGTAIVLTHGNVSGTYVSKIFDAGSEAEWNNLSYNYQLQNRSDMYCVDGGGDIYKSVDSGETWNLSQENFGRTTATETMFSNSDYLYILSSNGNEIWNSSDGTDFLLEYGGFNGKSPLVGDSHNEDLYIATESGEVWKSSDDGVSWNLQGDSNGEITNDPKGIVINSNGSIFIVDGTGSVYSSADEGVNWEEINEGYGGGTGTDGMDKDKNDNLYILLNTEIYKSSDSGINWEIINNSISPYGSSLVELLIDSQNNFYVLDAAGRVFKSSDFGINWAEIGDCNNDAANDPKGIAEMIQFTNLSFQIRNCSSENCSNETWQEADLNNIGLKSRYFQYKIDFFTDDVRITPQIFDVIVNYNVSVNLSQETSVSEETNSVSSSSGRGGESSLTLSSEQLSEPYTKEISDGGKIIFALEENGESHTLNLDSVQDNSARITIRSNPVTFTLKIGESKKINLTNQEYYDFYVKLENIVNGKAKLTIKSINEKIFPIIENFETNTSNDDELILNTAENVSEINQEEQTSRPTGLTGAVVGFIEARRLLVLISVAAGIVLLFASLKWKKLLRKKKRK